MRVTEKKRIGESEVLDLPLHRACECVARARGAERIEREAEREINRSNRWKKKERQGRGK